MNTDNISWSFEQLEEDKFKLVLKMSAEKGLIMKLFHKTMDKLKKVDKDKIDIDSIEEFKIVDKATFFPVIKNIVKKPVRKIFKEVRQDGIVVVHHYISEVKYKNVRAARDRQEGWIVHITIQGFLLKK